MPVNPASTLYPPIEPYAKAHIPVGSGHSLYFEECGNTEGAPMVYLHGGPGSGCSPRHRQFFDPAACRVVLFDQRGCGRSLPRGALAHNHTDALVQDIETLRKHLKIERWLVVGGSWGAGLALAYAAAHPEACLALVLRGVFLGRDADMDWFFGGGALRLPDAWQHMLERLNHLPDNTHGDVLHRLHVGLQGADAAVALACALAWEAWEQSLSQHCAVAPRQLSRHDADATRLIDKYRVQSHYLVNHCFRKDAGLLPDGDCLAGLPTAILHGRNDWICRPEAALYLHRMLPGSRLHWVDGCGHDPFVPANASAMVATIQHFVTHGNFAHWGALQPGSFSV